MNSTNTVTCMVRCCRLAYRVFGGLPQHDPFPTSPSEAEQAECMRWTQLAASAVVDLVTAEHNPSSYELKRRATLTHARWLSEPWKNQVMRQLFTKYVNGTGSLVSIALSSVLESMPDKKAGGTDTLMGRNLLVPSCVIKS